MSWRFVVASSAVTFVLAFSGTGRGQDSVPAAQEKPGAPAASDAKKPTVPRSKARVSRTRSRTRGATEEASSPPEPETELATFGAGCFWHVEATFERLPGVLSAVSGYAGGNVPYPSYEMVHEGMTGHAEVVMVQYDPEVISYERLLRVFWSSHDPTTPNRQGPDVGPQYRSIILYHNEAQRKAAVKSYQALANARAFNYPIVTQIAPLNAFYRAEDYHQDYYGGKPRTTAKHRKTVATKAKSAPATTTKPSAKAKAASPAPADH